jgi:hypothetical protein
MQYLSCLFGVVLLVVAVFFIKRLLQREPTFRESDPELKSVEMRFHKRQCRRRIQCGVLLAALAVGMMAEPWIVEPVPRVVLAAGMLIVIGWMMLLAMFDMILTNMHYRRMSNRYHHEQIRLEAKVKDILRQGEGSNGREEDDEGLL